MIVNKYRYGGFGLPVGPVTPTIPTTYTKTPAASTSTPSTTTAPPQIPSVDLPSFVSVPPPESHTGYVASWAMPTDKPWQTVFNADFYYAAYADLAAMVGQYANDMRSPTQLLFEHFQSNGIREGRCASPTWCVTEYVQRYPDLQAALKDWWGGDYSKALEHWFSNGIKEQRVGKITAGVPAETHTDVGPAFDPGGMLDDRMCEACPPNTKPGPPGGPCCVALGPPTTPTNITSTIFSGNKLLIAGAAALALLFLRK